MIFNSILLKSSLYETKQNLLLIIPSKLYFARYRWKSEKKTTKSLRVTISQNNLYIFHKLFIPRLVGYAPTCLVDEGASTRYAVPDLAAVRVTHYLRFETNFAICDVWN